MRPPPLERSSASRFGLVAALALFAPAALAQTSARPFGPCTAESRAGALLLIPDAPALRVLDSPLEPGDVVAALAPDGSCVGEATWDGSGVALRVWADDPMTPVLDGLLDGDPVELAVWDRSDDRIHRGGDLEATFDAALSPQAGFVADALFALARDGEAADRELVTLGDVYPNPVLERARIPFRLDAAADVTVEVFDTLGRSIAVVFEGRLGAGAHTVPFEADGLSSGAYLYRLNADGALAQGQLVVAR